MSKPCVNNRSSGPYVVRCRAAFVIPLDRASTASRFARCQPHKKRCWCWVRIQVTCWHHQASRWRDDAASTVSTLLDLAASTRDSLANLNRTQAEVLRLSSRTKHHIESVNIGLVGALGTLEVSCDGGGRRRNVAVRVECRSNCPCSAQHPPTWRRHEKILWACVRMID